MINSIIKLPVRLATMTKICKYCHGRLLDETDLLSLYDYFFCAFNRF